MCLHWKLAFLLEALVFILHVPFRTCPGSDWRMSSRKHPLNILPIGGQIGISLPRQSWNWNDWWRAAGNTTLLKDRTVLVQRAEKSEERLQATRSFWWCYLSFLTLLKPPMNPWKLWRNGREAEHPWWALLSQSCYKDSIYLPRGFGLGWDGFTG